MGNGIDSDSKKRILEQFVNSIGREEGTPIRRLPSISRSVWNQLPKIVQDILENEHGYNHYNPQTDNIESGHLHYDQEIELI